MVVNNGLPIAGGLPVSTGAANLSACGAAVQSGGPGVPLEMWAAPAIPTLPVPQAAGVGMARYFAAPAPLGVPHGPTHHAPIFIGPRMGDVPREDAGTIRGYIGRFLDAAGDFWKGLRMRAVEIALLPLSVFAMSAVPWSPGTGGGRAKKMPGMTSRLHSRLTALASKNVFISVGFYQMLAAGDMKPAFAEMLLFGLIVRMDAGKALSNDLVGEVIGAMRAQGVVPEEHFSAQFRAELGMAGRRLEDHFVVVEDDGRKIISTMEEPVSPEAEETEVFTEEVTDETPVLVEGDGGPRVVRAGAQEPEVVEAEFVVTPESDLGVGHQMVIAGAGTALSTHVVSRQKLLALGLPADSIHSLAEYSPELAQHAVTGMLQLELLTDAQKVADAIRVIRMLFKHAPPEEKKDLLRKLADIFLTYDESLKAEKSEDVNRIKRELIRALHEMGVRPSFVRDLETFINGNENQKNISMQGMTAALKDGEWDDDLGLGFARYLVVRLILAEVRRGTSKVLLKASMDCVRVFAPEIVAEGQVSAFVSALMIRSSAGDVTSEQSVVFAGLNALVGADRDAAIVAMEEEFKPNMFQPTDVLLYRLLARYHVDERERRRLAENMLSDYAGIARMDKHIRRALREAIVIAGEAAIVPIIDEYARQDAAKNLSRGQREDLIALVDEIAMAGDASKVPWENVNEFLRSLLRQQGMMAVLASLKMMKMPQVSSEIKRTVFEWAAERLYSDYRHDGDVQAGVNSLAAVGGNELLAYFRRKFDAATSDDEKKFYVARMVAKIETLGRRELHQERQTDWAFNAAMTLYKRYGHQEFGLIPRLFSSAAVSPAKIRDAYEKISSMDPDPNIPERERALLIAMAGNHALPQDYLIGTVGENLAAIMEGRFRAPWTGGGGGVEVKRSEPKPKTVSVVLPLDLEGYPEIGDELRAAVVKFVEEHKNKFAFDPQTGQLSVTGVMTAVEAQELSAALQLRQSEKVRVGKNEIDGRVGSRLAMVDRLVDLSAEVVERRRKFEQEYGDGVGRMQVDLGMAMSIVDHPPRRKFAEAVDGMVKLYLNRTLSRDVRDGFLGRLMDIHDKAIADVRQSTEESRYIDEWSYAVVRPLAGLFISGALNASARRDRAFKFIVGNALWGNLDAASRKAVLQLFAKYLHRFKDTPGLISYVCDNLCAVMEIKPDVKWAAEREFLASALKAFGENGDVTAGALDARLETRMRLLAFGEMDVPIDE